MNNICVFCENWQPDEYGSCRKEHSAAFPRLCRNMKLIPITPEQFRKRTGKEYPDNRAVYARFHYFTDCETTGHTEEIGGWRVTEYENAKTRESDYYQEVYCTFPFLVLQGE